MMFMRNILIYILLLLGTVSLSAQSEPTDSLTVPKGKVIPVQGAFLKPLQERDSVLIADQLQYGFELSKVQEGTGIILPELPEKQDYRMMYLTPWMIDTVKVTRQKKGLPRLLDLRASVTIASFEEGNYELAPIVVGRVSEDGVTDTLVFEPLKLEVRTMPVDTATFKPHDIKAQIRYPLTLAEILPWAAGGWLTIMLAILAVCLYIMYRRTGDPAFDRKEPAHIIALRKLDGYRGSKMWAPEKQKTFYSGVTDTLREYMAARYGVAAMEMTTAEIFDELKKEEIAKGLYSEVKELFELADFVKFAKYVASDDDNASALPVAVRFVTETYQAELETEEQSAAAEKTDDAKGGGE